MKKFFKTLHTLSITFLVLGLFSIFGAFLKGSSIDKDGIVHDPLAFISIGLLLIYAGLLLGLVRIIFLFLIPKIRKK